MNNKSFIHKIIWIPNYTSRPKGLTQWLAMFYNVFLVIAIYRISTSAADNFLQILGVVAFVFFVFNLIPYQIILVIDYISRKISNKGEQKEKAPLSLYIFLILIIFLFLIIIDIIFNDHQILDLYLCRGTPPVSSGCYD